MYSEESPGRVLPPLCFLNQIDGSTLRTLCLQHGPLITFHLNLTQGNAVVRYSSKEEAAKAQKSLHMYVPPLPCAALAAARWCGGWALWVGPGAAATEHRGQAGGKSNVVWTGSAAPGASLLGLHSAAQSCVLKSLSLSVSAS